MDLRRLRIGDLIVGIAGALLIVSLFLPWYGFEGSLRDAGLPSFLAPGSVTGWESLSGFDIVLLLAGLLGVALVVVTATQRSVAVPVALSAIVTIVAMVAGVIVAYRVATLPDTPASIPKQVAPGIDAVRRGGLWVAVVAVVLEIVGGWASMRDERLSRPGRPTDITGAPIPSPRRVEPLAAPLGTREGPSREERG